MSTFKLKFTVEFTTETDTEYYPSELKINDPDSIAKFEEDNCEIQMLLDTAMEDKAKSKLNIKVTPVK